MDTPPGTKPPLGPIVIVVMAPILAMSTGVAASLLAAGNADVAKFGEIAPLASLAWMIAATILASVLIGQRSGTSTGALAFLGLLLFYAGFAYAGFYVMRNPAILR